MNLGKKTHPHPKSILTQKNCRSWFEGNKFSWNKNLIFSPTPLIKYTPTSNSIRRLTAKKRVTFWDFCLEATNGYITIRIYRYDLSMYALLLRCWVFNNYLFVQYLLNMLITFYDLNNVIVICTYMRVNFFFSTKLWLLRVN